MFFKNSIQSTPYFVKVDIDNFFHYSVLSDLKLWSMTQVINKNFINKIWLFLLLFSLNSLINLSYANERIVVAGDALTEIVFDLGAGEDIVGVDSSSRYPKQVTQLPQIGNVKLLNIESVLSLTPSLVISFDDAEIANVLKQISQAKVEVLTVKRVPSTIELLYENINKIAAKLGREKEGQKLIKRIQNDLSLIQNRTATRRQKTKVLCLMNMEGNIFIAGKNTAIDALITIAGGENLATHNSVRTYTSESLIAMNPEVIILTNHSIEELGGFDKINTIPGITETDAYKNHGIVIIDDRYLFEIGPRVVEVVFKLFNGFYPE